MILAIIDFTLIIAFPSALLNCLVLYYFISISPYYLQCYEKPFLYVLLVMKHFLLYPLKLQEVK